MKIKAQIAADQCLCFRYVDSTIPLLSISEISSLYPSSVAVQPCLCRTWLETPMTGADDTAHMCKINTPIILDAEYAMFVVLAGITLRYTSCKQVCVMYTPLHPTFI